MSNGTLTIDPFGFPMEVDFYYTPAYPGSWDEPSEREDASIEAVRVGGVDINDMLSLEQSQRIERALLKAIHDKQDEAREDAVDYASDRINGYSNVFFDALNRITGTR